MNKWLITLSFLWMAGNCTGQTRDRGCCVSKYTEAQWDSLDAHQLGAEYRRLKRSKCEACGAWGSHYNGVMTVLGNKLNGTTKKEVVKAMGKPDAVKDGTYIYLWRGWHDYLYFSFSGGRATPQWYYAFE